MNSHLRIPLPTALDQRAQITNYPIEANGKRWWVTARAWRDGTKVTIKVYRLNGCVNSPEDLEEALQNLAMRIGEEMDRRIADPTPKRRGRPKKEAA